MKTKQIPIYKAARELFIKTMHLTENFPRSRVKSFSPLIESVTDLLLSIRKANNSQSERVNNLNVALGNIEVIELFSQIAHDTKTINNEAYAELIELTDSVKRQAIGWKKFS